MDKKKEILNLKHISTYLEKIVYLMDEHNYMSVMYRMGYLYSYIESYTANLEKESNKSED
jgi:hypothetical protein